MHYLKGENMSKSSFNNIAPKKNLWIKKPLSAFTANQQDASNGIVISNGIIIELVPAGGVPQNPIDQTFDAHRHVLIQD